MKMIRIYKLIFVFSFLALLGCKEDDPKPANTLTVSTDLIRLPAEGGTKTVTVETDANSWSVENYLSDWVTVSPETGTAEDNEFELTVDSRTLVDRYDSIAVMAGNADPVYIVIKQLSSDYLYSLSSNRIYFEFSRKAKSAEMTVTSEAPMWTLSSDADWITFDVTSGGVGEFTVTVSVSENMGYDPRTENIILSASGAPTTEIPVTQKGDYFPDYNTNPIAPDATGMESTATSLKSKMGIGWNAGNTMEATGGETAWGNPEIDDNLIKLIKANGFNSIRIPCAWNQYANPETGAISNDWLNRVKEVVQLCVDNDMYALLNIHWDGGWLEEHCTPSKQEEINAKQKAFWQQIATHLRDFDEHLLFASANEPNVSNATEMAVLTSYHQTFVDAVRSTGGRNSYRNLVVQGPSTNIDLTNTLMNTLPTDEVANRMMVEVHYYDPYQFCLMAEDADWGNMFYYWGNGNHSTTDTERNATSGEEAYVDATFQLMFDKFMRKGIPIVLGEYSAMRRSHLTGADSVLHEQSRASYTEYVTRKALDNGMIPFYWDNGGLDNNASAIFDRHNNSVFELHIIEALNNAVK